MDTTTETETYIQLTADELIAEIKKDPKAAKAKYNDKMAVVTGDITRSYAESADDWVKLNKQIFCKIKLPEGLKDTFKDVHLRYAVKGNKNVKARGKITFGFGNIVTIRDCDLSIDGLYAQNPDDLYKMAEKSVKLSKKFMWSSLVFAVVSLFLPFISIDGLFFCGFGMVISALLLVFAIGVSIYYNEFFRSVSANTLSSGAEGVNISAHVGSSIRLFSQKLIASENYKVSVSPRDWKNVKLDSVAKKFISRSTLFANSIKGVFVQALIFIPYIIIGFSVYVAFSSIFPDKFVERFEETIIGASWLYALIVYIVINMLFLAKTNSLLLKYAKEVVQNQKNWINNR